MSKNSDQATTQEKYIKPAEKFVSPQTKQSQTHSSVWPWTRRKSWFLAHPLLYNAFINTSHTQTQFTAQGAGEASI